MKCLCNKNVPRVARGNNFTLIVELQQIVISDEGKEITTQIEGTVGNVNICPSNGEPVGWNDWQMAQTSNGAAVAINIPSTQPLGAYGIEITGTRTNGNGAFRWYAKPGEGFIIVDASSDNYLTDMVRIYTITGVVGVGSSSSGGGEQVQADWNQTNTNAKDFIKNKPTIPSVPSWAMQPTKPGYSASEVGALPSSTQIPSKTSDLQNDSGFLTQHQSLANYEQKISIIANPALVSNTLAIPVSQLGSYYRLVVSAPTTITLPDMANETVTTITGVIVNVTLSTGGNLTLTATQPIYENGLSDIEEGGTFEINAIYNGSYWAVTVTKLELYNPS